MFPYGAAIKWRFSSDNKEFFSHRHFNGDGLDLSGERDAVCKAGFGFAFRFEWGTGCLELTRRR
jgi:hypothetical protein